jgi:esterase/lipase
MRALVLREHGAGGLSLETDFPAPMPGVDDVVLRVRATSLNYHDVSTHRGMPAVRIPMPVIMRRILAVLLMLVVLPGLVTPALAQTIGIVLMHGKTGSPSTVVDGLAIALQGAGYVVDTPEMCWSQRRIYDRPFLDCLTEIDSAIGRLRSRGAARIVVAGMSQGGDAALAYGARHANLAGIIALAPAAAPERQVGVTDIAQSVAQARALVDAGRGNETARFVDRNVRGTFSVRTTATIYLSYLDPQGPANMLDSVRKLRAPLLWVAGSADPSQTGANAEFNQAPANPLNRFVMVASAHLGTPDVARGAVLAWLPELR